MLNTFNPNRLNEYGHEILHCVLHENNDMDAIIKFHPRQLHKMYYSSPPVRSRWYVIPVADNFYFMENNTSNGFSF
jgi:hypothetical protein